jgi:archaellum component FlaC
MLSKKERIAQLETIVQELKQDNEELVAMINMILKDIRDLQQFKRFIELAQVSNIKDALPSTEKRAFV